MLGACVGVVAHPFKAYDGVGVHPLGRDFSVESKLLYFNGPKLVEVLGGVGVEEHAYLGLAVHILPVL